MATSTETRTPTIHDVAAALGMHKSTVSLGLSGKGNVSQATRERIAKVAKEMGYSPNPLAQRLAHGSDSNLVFLCAGNLDVGITTQKILAVQKLLREKGLDAPIHTFLEAPEGHRFERASQAAQIRHLCRQGPRAIVCSTQTIVPSVCDELRRYQNDGGILVSYDVPIPVECDQVIFDREQNSYLAARYLIEKGHRRLGIGLSHFVRNPDGTLGPLNQTQNTRLSGFRRALHEAGLEAREEWIFDHGTYELGGAEMAQRFLSLRERPTGVCIVNDYVALAFMVEVMRAGVRIPDDVSVVGHDDQPVAAYCPVPLTSATQPHEQIVQAVTDLLNERLTGSQQPPRTVTIRSEIVERESVVPPATQ